MSPVFTDIDMVATFLLATSRQSLLENPASLIMPVSAGKTWNLYESILAIW